MGNGSGTRPSAPDRASSEVGPRVEEVSVDRVAPSPYQPRKRTRDEDMQDLVESVRTHGILQPLVVRRRGAELELIAGERRLQAARRAGLERVPVVVREASDREALELALVENLQREDINAMDAAEAYQRLVDEFDLTQEQVAARVGKSRPAVANSLRLLKLPESIQASLRERRIDEGHAKVLAGVTVPGIQMRLWQKVIRRGLSVKQTAAQAAKMAGGVPRGTMLGKPKSSLLDPNLRDLQDRLRHRLSAHVRIQPKGKGGVIEISYADDEDLDRIWSELEA